MTKRKPARTEAVAPAVVDRDQRTPIEAIRAAAFRQFAERGYPVVTVRDIMKACGLTQGALYNHFKSKDELLHDIIASTQAELERICQQAVAAAHPSSRACRPRRTATPTQMPPDAQSCPDTPNTAEIA